MSRTVPPGWPDDPTATHDPGRTHPFLAPPPGGPEPFEPRLAAWTIVEPGTEPPEGATGRPAFELEMIAGVGGFGEVWQARQLSLGRTVALKRLRRPAAGAAPTGTGRSRERAELFRQEARITALLEHPSVVPVHDLGCDDAGEPVLAMRFVRGTLWKELLDRDLPALDPDEYLARHLPVLRGVAQALAYAHSRGVVHRDVKPGQVMVGEFGEVLLLDWGLAIHVGEEPPAPGAPWAGVPTRATATNPAGTLAYMAPEQTDPDAARIGPWTDVYLLGGTLYTLLTGALPHPASGTSTAFRQAESGEVVPPGDACPDRPVPAELSALAMRCLAPLREGRPGSVREVIAALDDFLGGATRRRQSIALTNTALASLERGVGDYRAHAETLGRLARARELWPGNHDAEALAGEVAESFARKALARGDLVLARLEAEQLAEPQRREPLLAEVDAQAGEARRIARQRRLALGAAGLLLAVVAATSVQFAVSIARERDRAETARRGEQLARARSEELLGFLLRDLKDELENAGRLPVLEKVAARALEEIRKIPPGQLSDAALAQRARALDMLGGVLVRQGSVAAATKAYAESREIRSSLLARAPSDPERRRDLAASAGHLAAMARAAGDLPAALAQARAARDLLAEGLAGRDPSPEEARDLSSAHTRIGELLADTGELAGALAEQRRAVALLEAVRGRHPSDTSLLRDVAVARSKVGDVLLEQGDLDGALAEYRVYKETMASLATRDPSNADYARELAVGHNSVGWVLRAQGDLDGALVELQAQREIGRRLVARDPGNQLLVRDAAQATAVIGRVLLARGDAEAGLAELRSAATVLGQLAEADPGNREARRDAAVAAALVGEVLVGRKDRTAAAVLRPAVASLATLAGADEGNATWTLDLATAELWLGRALLARGEGAAGREALAAAAARLAPLVADLPKAEPRVVATRASALLLLGRVDEARPLVEKALASRAPDPALRELARTVGLAPAKGR